MGLIRKGEEYRAVTAQEEDETRTAHTESTYTTVGRTLTVGVILRHYVIHVKCDEGRTVLFSATVIKPT